MMDIQIPQPSSERPFHMSELMDGLNFLIEAAENYDLPVPARIIKAAREDLVHWAINGHCTSAENERMRKGIDRSRLRFAFDLIAKYAAIDDEKLKTEIINSLKEIRDENPIFPIRQHADS